VSRIADCYRVPELIEYIEIWIGDIGYHDISFLNVLAYEVIKLETNDPHLNPRLELQGFGFRKLDCTIIGSLTSGDAPGYATNAMGMCPRKVKACI
jgi:hypothetical protein